VRSKCHRLFPSTEQQRHPNLRQDCCHLPSCQVAKASTKGLQYAVVRLERRMGACMLAVQNPTRQNNVIINLKPCMYRRSTLQGSPTCSDTFSVYDCIPLKPLANITSRPLPSKPFLFTLSTFWSKRIYLSATPTTLSNLSPSSTSYISQRHEVVQRYHRRNGSQPVSGCRCRGSTQHKRCRAKPTVTRTARLLRTLDI
jgi:hypothetical protein